MTQLTPGVSRRLDVLFPPESREAARQMIAERCGTGLPLMSEKGDDLACFDRIRFAVLKLSQGDLERLRQAIDEANSDWRDTLVAAGFGYDVNAHLKWEP